MGGPTQRVLVVLGRQSGPSLDDVRVLIVSDLLRRLIEDFHGGQAIVVIVVDGSERVTAALNRYRVRHPLAVIESTVEADDWLGGAPHMLVAEQATLLSQELAPAACRHIRVAGASGPASIETFDPLAVRLALITERYRKPVALDEATLRRLTATLDGWRRKVARWATSPSAPVTARTNARLRAALDDDLDVPTALSTLHEIEADDEVADGAKFETFALADRVLALELERLVGATNDLSI